MATTHIVVPGSYRAAAAGAQRVANVDPSRKMNLVLDVVPRKELPEGYIKSTWTLAQLSAAFTPGPATVRKINERLIPLHDALFVETSPAPVKYAASLLGRCTPEVRLPLWETTPATQEKVRDAMRGAGLLN